jgi:hypothetical protein
VMAENLDEAIFGVGPGQSPIRKLLESSPYLAAAVDAANRRANAELHDTYLDLAKNGVTTEEQKIDAAERALFSMVPAHPPTEITITDAFAKEIFRYGATQFAEAHEATKRRIEMRYPGEKVVGDTVSFKRPA